MKAPHAKGLPGWVEVAATHPEKIAEFYAQLFGWKISIMDSDDSFEYRIIQNGDKTIGGLSGKMNEYQPSQWLTYLETDDIAKTIDDITANGGTVYMPAMEMPGGQFTVASDPAGAPLGIVQSVGMNDSFGEENGLCWYELEVNNKFTETVDFYKSVFDWTPKTEYEAPEMTYLTVGDNIGIFTGPDFPTYFNGQAQWSVTFKVSDVEVIAAKVESLGGKVEAVTKDTPYGDFAMLRDPEGAFFVAMKPNRPAK